jgi:hypothetical protein
VSRTMTGRVLSGMLSPPLAAEALREVPSWDFLAGTKEAGLDRDLAAEEEERLRALGYID